MDGGPLTGIHVLDVSHSLAGPLTGMHLGDLGADVIKIERPTGDEWRFHEIVPGHPGRSRHHLQTNRNKRAVCIDLTTVDGQGIAHQLVKQADVLITNFRPGIPERLGIDWPTCEALNERLVYCQISAYGDGGPKREHRGYDIVTEAIGGFMPPGSATTDDPPRASPIPINDTGLPLLACTGILAALLERERSGRGQRVELSLLGMAVALNAHSLVRLHDQPPQIKAFSRAFYRVYETADGWIAIAALAEHLAHRFCGAVGMPELLLEERFHARADRVERDEELVGLFAPRIRTAATTHWIDAFDTAGVPCGPVRDRDELFDDGQVQAMGMLTEITDEELGRVTMMAPAVRLSRTPGEVRFPGRHLGADTRAVLQELGHSPDRIAEWEASAVVVTTPADPAAT